MELQNRCQLITYPNSFGRTLPELSEAAERHLQGIVDGIHILPFYPSSADRGFAPLSYYEQIGFNLESETTRRLIADFLTCLCVQGASTAVDAASTAELHADLRTKQFTIFINGKEEYRNGP